MAAQDMLWLTEGYMASVDLEIDVESMEREAAIEHDAPPLPPPGGARDPDVHLDVDKHPDIVWGAHAHLSFTFPLFPPVVMDIGQTSILPTTSPGKAKVTATQKFVSMGPKFTYVSGIISEVLFFCGHLGLRL